MKRVILIFLLLIGYSGVSATEPPPFDVSEFEHVPFGFADTVHDARCVSVADNEWIITTTGSDPYVYTRDVIANVEPDAPYVLAFEYQAPERFGQLHFLYQSAEGLQTVDSGLTPSAEWRWHVFDLSDVVAPAKWFRFDFGSRAGLEFKVRQCRLIKKTRAFELLSRRFTPFTLAAHGHDVAVDALDGEGLKVSTTGSDPYLATRGLIEKTTPSTPYIVAFEYKAPPDFGAFQVLYETHQGLQHINPVLEPSASWRWHFFDLGDPKRGIEPGLVWLRFDFGHQPDREFHLRNFRLIKARPAFDVCKEAHHPFALSDRGHHTTITTLPEGGWEIRTLGNDPYVAARGLVEAHDPDEPSIIAFEYQAPPDFGDISFYYDTPEGGRHVNAGVKPSNNWAWHLYDFTRDGQGLGSALKSFRIDFGEREDRVFKIRKCRLIKATPALRLRAALGDRADQVDQFGISLKAVVPQTSAIETVRYADEAGHAVTLSTYRHLDLDAETKRLALDPPVPLGPRLVAGEGAHPDNHTVVRILSPYQVCETQFLAFPLAIRGGVGVEAGRRADGKVIIATWPLRSRETRELRLYNSYGGQVGIVEPPETLSPPFTVAVGNFVAEQTGDELAITSRFAPTDTPPVLIYRLDGTLLSSHTIPLPKAEVDLLARGNELFIQDLTRKQAVKILPEGAAPTVIDFSSAEGPVRLFESVFEDRDFNLGGPEPRVSTLLAWKEGVVRKLDAGRMENIFWFDPQEVHNGSVATWDAFPDGTYIKNSLYNFLGAAMFWSPLVATGKIENRSYEDWVGGIDWEHQAFGGPHRKSWKAYDEGVPTVWTCAFTHRWNLHRAEKLGNKFDPETGLPRYLLLNRANESTGGGYFGKRLFEYGSQNFEQEALDKFYTYAQREFHRKLAPVYRRNPEMTLAIEPNHENEIVSGADSVGDYNPKAIEGFYHYLMALYGDLDALNQRVGSSFRLDLFDAPRGVFRGDWDRYDPENPYYRDWIEYNRILIYRRVGSSYREALLAGFPPELIKCHQIPDTYVFGSIVGISEGEVRISPIDWLLTTGAGFGFSRYGTYYQREKNIGQGAHSSGFDGMLIGEYASLNSDPQKALGQLLYLRDHGVSALHVMWWPADLDQGFNRAQDLALREMIAKHDVPKPGLAGGINQVRAWAGEGGRYDIASLGTGAEHTGLIKSLRADGSFEGSVYTVPFHAHVDVQLIGSNAELVVTDTPIRIAQAAELRQGGLIEVTFTVVSTNATSGLSVGFSHAGIDLADKRVQLDALEPGQAVRMAYKLPIILDEVELRLSTQAGALTLRDLQVIQHQDQAINLTKQIMEGKRHSGGVRFDVLPLP
ncbi:MAG: hypothetical protein ACI97B_000845 [Verrucomicrobiales bacterium]|jgi:hypothetical protein